MCLCYTLSEPFNVRTHPVRNRHARLLQEALQELLPRQARPVVEERALPLDVAIHVKWQLDFHPRPSPLGSSTVYFFVHSSQSSCEEMDAASTGLIMRPARAPRTSLPAKIFSSGGQSGLSFSSLQNAASAKR